MTNMLSVISGTKRGSTGSVSFDTVESQNVRAAAVRVIVEEAATDESHGSVWVSIAKQSDGASHWNGRRCTCPEMKCVNERCKVVGEIGEAVSVTGRLASPSPRCVKANAWMEMGR